MKHIVDLKVDLKEVKIIRELLNIEIRKNKLRIKSLNIIEYNNLLKDLLKKVQRGEIFLLEDLLNE